MRMNQSSISSLFRTTHMMKMIHPKNKQYQNRSIQIRRKMEIIRLLLVHNKYSAPREPRDRFLSATKNVFSVCLKMVWSTSYDGLFCRTPHEAYLRSHLFSVKMGYSYRPFVFLVDRAYLRSFCIAGRYVTCTCTPHLLRHWYVKVPQRELKYSFVVQY